jgi:hypothetical protein
MSSKYIYDTVEKLNMNSDSKEMVLSAIQAVTMLEKWDALKNYSPLEGRGFMFDDSDFMKSIQNKILELYSGHSGSSFAWTMRQIESIAKYGVDEYCKKFQ